MSERYRMLKGSVSIEENTVWNCSGPQMLVPPKEGHEIQGASLANRPELVLDTTQMQPIVVCHECCVKKGLFGKVVWYGLNVSEIRATPTDAPNNESFFVVSNYRTTSTKAIENKGVLGGYTDRN